MTRAADPAAAGQLQHLTRQMVLNRMDYYTHEQLPAACARLGLPRPRRFRQRRSPSRSAWLKPSLRSIPGTTAKSSLGSSTTVSSHRTTAIRP